MTKYQVEYWDAETEKEMVIDCGQSRQRANSIARTRSVHHTVAYAMAFENNGEQCVASRVYGDGCFLHDETKD